MDDKKIEFLVAQIQLDKITLSDVPEQFREAVTEKVGPEKVLKV